jgi:ABC-type lipoprotein export system ATPase subunit
MPESLISARDLRFGPDHSYRVSQFELKPGEKVMLIGPSGCGKTTFLEFLAGFRAGSAEKMHIHPSMGFIFQDLNLIENFSVRENLALELAAEAQEQAMRWLEELDFAPSENAIIKTISKGEQQRVAAVRALAKRPELLLADEPTSHLDRVRAEKLIGLLTKAARTALVVGHDPNLERFFDRVISFEKLTS